MLNNDGTGFSYICCHGGVPRCVCLSVYVDGVPDVGMLGDCTIIELRRMNDALKRRKNEECRPIRKGLVHSHSNQDAINSIT